MNKFLIFIFLFILQQSGLSQKGIYMGLNLNALVSRFHGDVYYLKRNATGYGHAFSLGTGQYGNRVYDNKTKDLFGRKYINHELGANYYKTNNLGLQGKYSFSYQFIINKVLNIDFGFCGILGIYQQKSEYNIIVYHQGEAEYEIVPERYVRVNLAIGFEVESVWRLNKKWQMVTGLKLPFYLFNPNDLGISKDFDPVLLGMEPVITLGIRYRLKK